MPVVGKSPHSKYMVSSIQAVSADGRPKRKEARVARVRELLYARVVALYKRGGDSELSDTAAQYASRELERLVAEGTVSEADLRRLVAAMRSVGGAGEDAEHSEVTASRVSAVRQNDSVTLPPLAAASQINCERDMSPSRKRQEQMDKDLWAQLTKKDVERHRVDEEMRLKARKEKMKRQRQVLDAQLAEAAKQRELQKQRDQEAEQEALHQQEMWRREAAGARERQQQLIAREREKREAEHRVAQERKERAERLRQEVELTEVAKIRAEMADDDKRQREKRMKVQDDIRRFMAFNQEQKAQKVAQRAEEAQLDKELHQQYLSRLEKQEQERKEALRKMYDKQQRTVKMGEHIQKGEAERLAEDERRAEEEQRKVLQRVSEEERKRRKRAEDEKQRVRECLAAQVRDRDRKRSEERKEEEKLRMRMLAEAEDEVKREREKTQAKRNAEKRNKSDLEMQIKAKRAEEVMTDNEQRFNRRLLQDLKAR